MSFRNSKALDLHVVSEVKEDGGTEPLSVGSAAVSRLIKQNQLKERFSSRVHSRIIGPWERKS